MKKLMLTAAAAALAGVASATNIYDYKASVKYVDLKTVSAKTDAGVKEKIYVKTVKSATLTGYLVTPYDCGCNYDASACSRFGMAPSFLVIQNKAAKSKDRMNSYVKLMPANLLSSWWTTKQLSTKKVTLEAQGYLFAGVGKRDVPDPVASPHYGLGDFDYPANRTAATQFLFGEYNMLDDDTFVEPFFDQAGFGKATYTYYSTDTRYSETHPCLFEKGGKIVTEYDICLSSLSGSLIGGSFLCVPNGQYLDAEGNRQSAWALSESFLCQDWDATVESFLGSKNDAVDFPQTFNGVNSKSALFYNVISGTWSIKANTKIASLCSERADVVQCAQKLDANFRLATFDAASPSKKNTAATAAILSTYAGNFVEKWFVNVQ